MPFDGIVTRAVTKELEDNIVPGKFSKIYQPTETELIFTIRSKGKNHSLLLSIHPSYARIHLTDETFVNPKTPPNFCMVLRKHLNGGHLESIRQDGMERVITFAIKTRNEIGDENQKELIFELMGRHSNIILVNKDNDKIIDSMKHIPMSQNRYRTILPGHDYIAPPKQDKLNPLDTAGEDLIRKIDFNAGKIDQQFVQNLVGFSPYIAGEIRRRANLGSPQFFGEKYEDVRQQILQHAYEPTIYRDAKEDFHVIAIQHSEGDKETFDSVNTMLDTFYSGKAERDRVKQRARDLTRFISNEVSKNKRKLKKHQQTLKKAEKANHYQKQGELLTAHMHLIQPGDTSVTVVDYYDPEQNKLVIEIDPNKTPSANAQRLFKTYQKLKNSKTSVEKEIKKANAEIAYFEQLLQQIEVANVDDIEEMREELRAEGYLKKQRATKGKNKPKKPQPEKFNATDGTTILVGKNNMQNEFLTMRLAHRDEIWLHTKDIPGSHVVIRDAEPSEETLLEAAQLAAYFSKSQNSSSVPVDYTKIRHVRKPNGAKPGFVIYDNQQTVFVTPSEKFVEERREK